MLAVISLNSVLHLQEMCERNASFKPDSDDNVEDQAEAEPKSAAGEGEVVSAELGGVSADPQGEKKDDEEEKRARMNVQLQVSILRISCMYNLI